MSLRLTSTLILILIFISTSVAFSQLTIAASPSEKSAIINTVTLDKNSTFGDVQKALGEPSRHTEDKKDDLFIYDDLGVIVSTKKKSQLVRQITITYHVSEAEVSPRRPFAGNFLLGNEVVLKTDSIEDVTKKANVTFTSMSPFPWYFFKKEEYTMLILYKAAKPEMISVSMVFDKPKKK